MDNLIIFDDEFCRWEETVTLPFGFSHNLNHFPPDNERTKRLRVLSKSEGWICHYCKKSLVSLDEDIRKYCKMTVSEDEYGHKKISYELLPNFLLPQIDHKIPRAKKGKDSFANLAISCPPCNRKKGVKDYELFLKEMRGE